MKAYVQILLFLKLSMIVQFTLVLFQFQSPNSILFLISDFFFKGLLGAFLITYFFVNGSPVFGKWDETLIGFGGVLLMFDAVYNVLPKVLEKYKIYFNPYTFYLSTRPENVATAKK
jgi:hypothetical protein